MAGLLCLLRPFTLGSRLVQQIPLQVDDALREQLVEDGLIPVSYTHLTLPTNREV